MDGPKGIDISQMTSAFAVVRHPQLVIDSLSCREPYPKIFDLNNRESARKNML